MLKHEQSSVTSYGTLLEQCGDMSKADIELLLDIDYILDLRYQPRCSLSNSTTANLIALYSHIIHILLIRIQVEVSYELYRITCCEHAI